MKMKCRNCGSKKGDPYSPIFGQARPSHAVKNKHGFFCHPLCYWQWKNKQKKGGKK